MSLFSDALGTALSEISRAQGSLVIVYDFDGESPLTLTELSVFDAAPTIVDTATGALIRSSVPALGVRVSDFPSAPAVGKHVSVAGTVYRVVDIEPDGQGGASLRLHKL